MDCILQWDTDINITITCLDFKYQNEIESAVIKALTSSITTYPSLVTIVSCNENDNDRK